MSFLELVKKEASQQNTVSTRKYQRRSKIEFVEQISEDYRPAGWLTSPLSFSETVAAFEQIKKKKKDVTNLEEQIIVHNHDILKSCYRTPKNILKLANKFIGKFNFDPHYNNYGFTGNEEFAEKDFKYLSGYSDEDDGFNISNWHRATNDLEEVIGWDNPPFNKLENAAKIVNEFSKEKEVRFAFLHTLDYTNYMQECLRNADYFIMLGRVQFLPMPGIKTSTARGSVGMSIYNSKLDIPESQFIEHEGEIYYCINLKKERQIRNLSQLSLEELLNPYSLMTASGEDLDNLIKGLNV